MQGISRKAWQLGTVSCASLTAVINSRKDRPIPACGAAGAQLRNIGNSPGAQGAADSLQDVMRQCPGGRMQARALCSRKNWPAFRSEHRLQTRPAHDGAQGPPGPEAKSRLRAGQKRWPPSMNLQRRLMHAESNLQSWICWRIQKFQGRCDRTEVFLVT